MAFAFARRSNPFEILQLVLYFIAFAFIVYMLYKMFGVFKSAGEHLEKTKEKLEQAGHKIKEKLKDYGENPKHIVKDMVETPTNAFIKSLQKRGVTPEGWMNETLSTIELLDPLSAIDESTERGTVPSYEKRQADIEARRWNAMVKAYTGLEPYEAQQAIIEGKRWEAMAKVFGTKTKDKVILPKPHQGIFER